MSSYTVTPTIVGRREPGSDLYNGIARIAEENNIAVGRVTGRGAVSGQISRTRIRGR